jgi:hypothetical protein
MKTPTPGLVGPLISVDELKIPYRRIGRKHIFARDCLVEWVKEGANAESEHQSSNQS